MLRGAILLAVFLTIGRFTTWVSHDALDHEAGFLRGLLHGAAMPLALPKLAMGHDVAIYAARHTGRTYNLGYTVGVNLCGALFFGVMFYRFSRWRRKLRPTSTESST